jgi:hypothetical protein
MFGPRFGIVTVSKKNASSIIFINLGSGKSVSLCHVWYVQGGKFDDAVVMNFL